MDEPPPWVACHLDSFIHVFLAERGQLHDYVENRPKAVACVHPYHTLLGKLNAITGWYARTPFDPDRFVRHYEDAVHIIRNTDRLPPLPGGMTLRDMATTAKYRLRTDDPAFLLNDERRADLEASYHAITPLFWGPRVALDDCCGEIRAWLENSDVVAEA